MHSYLRGGEGLQLSLASRVPAMRPVLGAGQLDPHTQQEAQKQHQSRDTHHGPVHEKDGSQTLGFNQHRERGACKLVRSNLWGKPDVFNLVLLLTS